MGSSAKAETLASRSAEGSGTATLETLARTARQVALYGPDHPIAVEALSQACRDLEAAAHGGKLVVRAEPDALLWNETRLAGSDGNVARFHSAMRDRLIATVEITGPVRPSDLAQLLCLLAEDLEELASDGAALDALRGNAGAGVRITRVDFAGEMLVSEAVWQQLSQGVKPADTGSLRKLIACCASRLPPDGATATAKGASSAAVPDPDRDEDSAEEVVAGGIARLIQQAGEACYFGDQGEWQAWRNAAAAQLSSLSRRWRSAIFRAPAGVSSECPDMLSLIAMEMDESDCVSIIMDHPDSIRADRSDMLALALDRILADRNRRKSIEAALHARAVEQGVPEAVYQNVVGLLVSRIDGKPPPDPQSSSLESSSSAWAESLAAAREDDIEDLLQTTEDESVWHSRLCLLLESLHAHLTISQYGTVISLLTKAADECAGRAHLEGLVCVLSALGGEAGGGDGRDPSRRAVAAGALARASTDRVVTFLVGKLDDASEEVRSSIIEMLGLLAGPGLRALVQIARTGDDVKAQLAVDTLLARDSRDLSHLHELVLQARGISLERALSALINSKRRQTAEVVRALTADAGEEARLHIVRLIAEGRRKDLGRVLVPMLRGSSFAVRTAAVDAVAELGVREAAPALCEMIREGTRFGEGARLREAAARALGALGDGSAVPTLCAVLEGKALLSKLGSHGPRIAAAEALAALGGPDSRQALEQGCRSRHPAVREACKKALSRLLVRERLRARSSSVR